ncbi:hypothetical protein G7Y89_g384 [Cudoniella acicularis]|uniref:Rhodopsin domain-containing protein n=1 Tax=Cudoniella acicularis TaxID=354080 RepID=A0A8H4RY52_9HELO|nr:hypothetical protein G7Y89_g384 [Cudoniella acicularis]
MDLTTLRRSPSLVAPNNHMGITVIIVESIAASLAIFSFGMRIWARRITRTVLGPSDYTCFFALFFGLALFASTVYTVTLGLGENAIDVAPSKLNALGKVVFAGQIFWMTSNTFIRCSVILFLVDLFPTRKFRLASWSLFGFNITYSLAIILETLLVCRPIAFNWDKSIEGGKCADQENVELAVGIINIVLDVCTVLLPMPVLWGLHMNMKKRLGLCAIFSLGILICIITIIRCKLMMSIDFLNATKSYASVGVFAILEPLLGVVNACLPLMRPVLARFFSKPKQRDAWTSHPTEEYGSRRTGGAVGETDSTRRLRDKGYQLEHVVDITVGRGKVKDEEEGGSETEDEERGGGRGIRVQNSYQVK